MDLRDPVSAIVQRKGRIVWAISPNASVYEAIETMATKGIGALIVGNGSSMVGIVSERDYARKVILQGRSSRETTVHEIMTTQVVTVTPQHTVDECMHLMTDHRIRHLPVLDAGQVAAVLSIGDLVKWIISAHEQTISQLHNYISGKYPA